MRARLIADPSLIPDALEEFNRYYTPVTALARTVKQACTLGGHSFKPGDRVLLGYGSANRDEDAFSQPNEVIIDRAPNRHLSFGLGPHHCIGARFARAQSTIVVEEVLRLMPDYQILESGTRTYPAVGITNSYLSLPALYHVADPVVT
jgi:cytochrome P450